MRPRSAKRRPQAWGLKERTKGRQVGIRVSPPRATAADIKHYCNLVNGNPQGTVMRAIASGRSMIIIGRYNCTYVDLKQDVTSLFKIDRSTFPAHPRSKGHKSKHASTTKRRTPTGKKKMHTSTRAVFA